MLTQFRHRALNRTECGSNLRVLFAGLVLYSLALAAPVLAQDQSELGQGTGEAESEASVEASVEADGAESSRSDAVDAERAEGEMHAEGLIDKVYNSVRTYLRTNIAPPLKAFHAPIDLWLGRLSLDVAMACAMGLYAVAVIWVWMLRRDFVFRGAPGKSAWYDLRLWATLVVVPYVAVYLVLGR